MARTKGATAKYLYLVYASYGDGTVETSNVFKQAAAALRWFNDKGFSAYRRVEIASNTDQRIIATFEFEPGETVVLPKG